jgi:hypothetical protein
VITPETDNGRVRERKAVIQAFVLVISLSDKKLLFCRGSIGKSKLCVKKKRPEYLI